MVRVLRLLITGSRSWPEPEIIDDALIRVIEEYGADNLILVSGACPTGADKMCEDFFERMGLPIERHPADWDRYGNSAGFRRNSEMVTSGADLCLAFIHNESKGAMMTAAIAEKSGIRVLRYSIND